MTFDEIIGTKIRAIRQSHRLTLTTVAEGLGDLSGGHSFSVPKLSRWERGLYGFRIDDLFLLSQYWGVTVVNLCVTPDRSGMTSHHWDCVNSFIFDPRSPSWRTSP